MKKLTGNQLYNLLFLVCIALFLFTPVGTYLKVYINRLVAVSPSEEKPEERKNLTEFDYQWRLRGISGELFDFEKTKGKVVLVNFWATWCPPCIAEMPSLQRLYTAYKDKVVFLFVTFETPDQIQVFLEKNEYNLPVYQPITDEPKLLENSSIPATYLIDANGAIVIRETGAADWDTDRVHTILNSLLKQKH